MASFQRARFERTLQPKAARKDDTGADAIDFLPAVNSDHMSRLTDGTGIPACDLQRTKLSRGLHDRRQRACADSAHPHGSFTGDLDEQFNLSHSTRYLAFLWLAFNTKTGRFRNFLGYDRRWLEDVGSDDSHGRALWSLGTVLGTSRDSGLRGAAGRLFEAAVPATLDFTSPRAWAFCTLGMQAYLDWFPGDRAIQRMRNTLADRLLDIYDAVIPHLGDGLRRAFPIQMPAYRRR